MTSSIKARQEDFRPLPARKEFARKESSNEANDTVLSKANPFARARPYNHGGDSRTIPRIPYR